MRLLAKRVLDDLERYLRLDVRYFAQGIGALWATQGFLLASGLALTVFLSRFAGPEGYGQLQFALALLGTVSLAALPGLNTLVSVYVAKGQTGVAKTALEWKLLASCVGALVLCASAFVLWKGYGEPRIAGMVLVGAVLFPIIYSFDVVHSYFVGLRQIGRSCWVQVWTEGISSLCAIAAFWVTGSLTWTFGVMLGVKGLGLVFASRVFLREKGEWVSGLARSGFGFTVVNALPTVRQNAGKLLVSFFLGFVGTAIYAVSQAIAEQLMAVGKQVALLVLPKLAGGKRSDALLSRLFLLSLFFVVLGGALAIVAPFLISLLFGGEYADARLLSSLFVLAVIPQAVGTVLAKALEVEQRMKGLYWVHGLHAGLEIGLMAFALPFFGLLGVAAAKAVSAFVFVIVVLREYRLQKA